MVIKCNICGKTGFKSKAGLAGHRKIAHGADKRKTVPDEIGRRLEAVEKNQARIVDTLAKFIEVSGKNFWSVKGWIETSTNHLIELYKQKG